MSRTHDLSESMSGIREHLICSLRVPIRAELQPVRLDERGISQIHVRLAPCCRCPGPWNLHSLRVWEGDHSHSASGSKCLPTLCGRGIMRTEVAVDLVWAACQKGNDCAIHRQSFEIVIVRFWNG